MFNLAQLSIAKLLWFWSTYSKQIIFAAVLIVLALTIIEPNIVVHANGATSTGG